MNFSPGCLYHIYNRTFERVPAFRSDRNYRYFVDKLTSINNICDIIAYCLMPTHFHLMVNIPFQSSATTLVPHTADQPRMQVICRKLGTILSSYTQAFNKQERRVGSLFQPRTKAKLLDEAHAVSCFHYIHLNPVKDGLVHKPEDWRFSSFLEYMGQGTTRCNHAVANQMLGVPIDGVQFYDQSCEVLRKSFSFNEMYDEHLDA